MIPGGAMRVILGEEGILLLFIASDDTEVAFDVLAIAEQLDADNARSLLLWCRDRIDDAATYGLPTGVREEIESRIAEAESLVDAAEATKE
jgi:hypothetical protein